MLYDGTCLATVRLGSYRSDRRDLSPLPDNCRRRSDLRPGHHHRATQDGQDLRRRRPQRLEAYQSGFLISPQGHVLTAWSYVLDTDYITVTLE